MTLFKKTVSVLTAGLLFVSSPASMITIYAEENEIGGGTPLNGENDDVTKEQENENTPENEEGADLDENEDGSEEDNDTAGNAGNDIFPNESEPSGNTEDEEGAKDADEPALTRAAPPLRASNYVDPDKDTIYIVEDDSELDETITDPHYYTDGTFTKQHLLEEGDYYIQKEFDWTDKASGEGNITFKTKFNTTKDPSIAVYALTACSAHGFTKEYARSNIQYLLNNYDRVDLVWATGTYNRVNVIGTRGWGYTYGDIHYQLDVGEDSDGNSKQDYLDIIDATGAWTNSGIKAQSWSTNTPGDHFGINLYTGLYAYFSGLQPTDAVFTENQDVTLSEDDIVNKPTAIYISFDGLLDTREVPSGFPQERTEIAVPAGTSDNANPQWNYLWSYPRIEYDCWGVLRSYKDKKAYFSLGTSGDGSATYGKSLGFNFINNTANTPAQLDALNTHPETLHYELWNELVALANPQYMKDNNNNGVMDKGDIPADQMWNGETRTPEYTEYASGYCRNFYKSDVHTTDNFAYEFDYHYGAKFDDLDIPVIGVKDIELSDTIAEPFGINGDISKITVSIEYPAGTPEEKQKTEVTPAIDGNTVSFSVADYVKGSEVTLTIPVKMDDQIPTDVNVWRNTNAEADLAMEFDDDSESDYEIASPKAHIEGYIITTEVIGGTISPGSGGIRIGGTRDISYEPNESEDSYFDLEYIEVDGRRLSEEELEEFAENYTFSNVQSDHTIKVVYLEYFDLEGTKTWNDGGIRHDNAEDIVITVSRTYDDGSSHTETLDPQEYPAEWTGNEYTIKRLPVYQDEEGTIEYEYEIAETVTDAAKEKLLAAYGGAAYDEPVIDGFDITNNLKPVRIDAEKIWDDGNDKDGTRPKEIKVQLYANGEKLDDPAVLSAANSWKYTWNGLPLCKDGEMIKYTVQEEQVSGYSGSVKSATDEEGNAVYTFTNKLDKRVPDTSDRSDSLFWLSILFVSLAAVCSTAFILRRNS